MAYIDPITSDIERYTAEHGLTRSQVGDLLLNDPNLIRDLRNGRELRRSTRARLVARMKLTPQEVERAKNEAADRNVVSEHGAA